MNPKKHIFEHIKKFQESDQAKVDPEEAAKWQELFDGMSTGTARIIIDREAQKSIPEAYGVDLRNEGRYYVAKIVSHNGSVLQRLLVDKQTGDVRFV